LTAAETVTDRETLSPAALIPLLEAAAEAAGTLNIQATEAVKAKLAPGDKIDNAALEREQHVAHGLAWMSTYAEGIRQLADYAKRMEGEGRFGEMESLLSQIAAGEYLAQLAGGVTMSQGEVVRLHELGLDESARAAFLTEDVTALIEGVTPEMRTRVVELIQDAQGAASANFGDPGLEETYEEIRNEMRRFS
jgi:(2S)-methylsuccinyl-CoA dehydrogenase